MQRDPSHLPNTIIPLLPSKASPDAAKGVRALVALARDLAHSPAVQPGEVPAERWPGLQLGQE